MYINISLADLVRVPHFNFDNLDKVLYEMGMDVKHGYTNDVFTHRTLDGQIATCTLYQGLERLDKEWLSCPLSSIEAVMASTNDRGLREDLSGMNKRAGFLQKVEE